MANYLESIPSTMKGIQLVGHGGLDQLVINQQIDTPIPCESDVLIKVGAAGVNNTDLNTRIGWYSKNDNDSEDASWAGAALKLPLIQGADVCGVVVAVGEMADKQLLGKRVLIEPSLWEADGEKLQHAWYFGSECNGGFAEYAKVSAKHAHVIECELTDEELASFPCSYSTAENLLTRAKVKPDDRVLITGASGGVGSAAIQLAKARGAEVVAITSGSKAEGIRNIGADLVVDREQSLVEALGENSVDVVIDLVAGEVWPQLLEVMKPFGRYAVSGAIGGPMVQLDVRTLYLKDLSFFGCTVLEPEVFPNLIKRIEAGDIKPLVDKVYPLEEIHEAQTQFATKKHIGKIVLKIS